MLYEIQFALRCLFYIVHILCFWLYGILVFFSKPGSRSILPALGAVALFLNREAFYPAILAGMRANGFRAPPDSLVFDGVLFVAFVLAACAYVVLSRGLSLVLGTFPPITRPLRPMRRLRPANRTIRPVTVRQVVPPLRRSWF